MSGVKNLRAMFEQKNDAGTSPPSDRGRSPGPGLPSVGSPTPSSRPLSKVRTNFVAVEKDGRIGLQRQNSGDSVSVSSRRMSNETENTTPAPTADKNDPFVENMAKNATPFRTNLASEPIPESPSQGSPTKSSPVKLSPAKLSPTKASVSPDITPGPNPDKIVDEEETHTKLTSADPTVKRAANGTSNGLNGATEPKEKTKSTSGPSKPATKTHTPISTSAKTVSKPAKSPLTAKQPKSPAKEAGKAPEKKPASSATRDHASRPATKPVASSTAKKPAALELSPSAGFVKPKPKSPTRPAKLPSSLTAPTSASASKLGGSAPPPRRSLSRTAGTLGVPTSSQRSTSRASVPTTAAPAAEKTLKRQASTINRSRPSLGPPPKLTAKDHPQTRKENNVDDGFLARMMRPTQSSSSKTADKAPVTPPRKQPAATVRKTLNHGEGSAKKAAAKITEAVKKDSGIKKPAVAKAEVKKAIPASSAKIAEPTAKEVAPVVAQTDSSEAAIEAAKTSAETAATPALEKQETAAAPRSTTPESEPPAETKTETAAGPAAQTSEAALDTEVAVPDFEQSKVEEPIPAEEPQTEESSVVEEPEVVDASKLTNGEASLSIVDEPAPSDLEEVKIEELSDVKEDVASLEKDIVPAISADPEKVEDVEDLVQGTAELSLEKSD